MIGSDIIKNYRKGRTSVHNEIITKEKLSQVNQKNIELEKDFIDFLVSSGRAQSTINIYTINLHTFWCWNLEYNENKVFTKIRKKDFSKFQSQALTEWEWSPKRLLNVKATLSSLDNYIAEYLKDEYKGFKPMVSKIPSPANVAVKKRTVLTDNDIQKLLNVLIEREDYMRACLVALVICSGRRKSEITRFKVSHFRNSCLICDGELYKTPENIIIKRKKEMPAYVLSQPFKKYYDLWINQRKEKGIKGDWLFPSKNHGHWYDKAFTLDQMNYSAKIFSNILKKPFYWEALSSYFVTQLLEANVPEEVIREILGTKKDTFIKLKDNREEINSTERYFGIDGLKNKKPILEEI